LCGQHMKVNTINGTNQIKFQSIHIILWWPDEAYSENCHQFDKLKCSGGRGQWSNPTFGHMDNIFAAVLLLFEVSTMEMWPDVSTLQ
jgi:hypothetical protein